MLQTLRQKYGRTIIVIAIAVISVSILLFSTATQKAQPPVPLIEEPPQQKNSDEETITTTEQTPPSINIIVDVTGAVKHPGVYALTTEDRVIDAITMAGGYTDEANSQQINHAQKLQDEMQIYIATKGEAVAEVSAPVNVTVSASNATNSTTVNINQADEAALTTIPGVGPAKAQAIIAYRNEQGKFSAIEDIKKVTGIGDKTFERLAPFIRVQ